MAESRRRSSASTVEPSMRELDPSPVDTPPSPRSPSPADGEKPAGGKKGSAPSSSPAPHPSRLGLHGQPLTRTLQFLQKYSTYPFTLFLGLHITNTSLLPLLFRATSISSGSSTHLHTSDTFLLLTRPYYQSPLLEPVLILAPLATHLISGLGLRLHRRRLSLQRHGAESQTDRRHVPWPKLSVQSLLGYALLPLLAGHVLINRLWPLYVDGGSSGVGLRYVAHGFVKHPLLANVGYAALVAVASWHLVGGAAKWLRLTPEYVGGGGAAESIKYQSKSSSKKSSSSSSRRRRRRWWVVNGAAATVAATWMLGGLGVVGRGGKGLGTRWEVKAWDEIYRSIPVFGEWL